MALLTFYSSIAFKSPRRGIPKSFSKIPDTSSATVHNSKHTTISDTFLETSASCFPCSLTLSLPRMNATTTTPASWVPPLSTWATTMPHSTMPTVRRWTSPVTSLKPTLQGIMIIYLCSNDTLFWFCLSVISDIRVFWQCCLSSVMVFNRPGVQLLSSFCCTPCNRQTLFKTLCFFNRFK